MSVLTRGALALSRTMTRVRGIGAEPLIALTLLTGWGLVIWGLGLLCARWLPPAGIWAIGAGLFLLGCVGFRFIGILGRHGLYALSKADLRGRE